MKPHQNPFRNTINDQKWYQEWLTQDVKKFPTFNDYIDYKINNNQQ